jgi:hypothetical protein
LFSKEFHQPPSQRLKIFDEWAAYCVDNLVVTFGRYIENKLSETDKKGKHTYKLSDLLAEKPKKPRSLVQMFKEKMGITPKKN